MRKFPGIVLASLLAMLPCTFAPANALTLSTMMCVGNGCPNRVYAYHKCSNGFIWSARTHRCVRRVGEDTKNAHVKASKNDAPH